MNRILLLLLASFAGDVALGGVTVDFAASVADNRLELKKNDRLSCCFVTRFVR